MKDEEIYTNTSGHAKGAIHYLVKHFRDPAWQVAGVVVAIASIVVPVITSQYYTEKDASIVETRPSIQIASPDARELTETTTLRSKKMKVFIDDEAVEQVRIISFFFVYRGKEPIRSADFSEPITGTLPPDRRIISVEPGTKMPRISLPSKTVVRPVPGPLGPTLSPIMYSEARPIPVNIEKINDQTLRLTTPLMNPDDWFSIDVFTAENPKFDRLSTSRSVGQNPGFQVHQADGTYNTFPSEFTWECRVASVDCPSIFSYADPRNPAFDSEPKPDSSAITVNYSGWTLVWFVVVQALFLTLTINGVHRTVNWSLHRPQGVVISLLLFVSSFAVAKALVDIFEDRLEFSEQHVAVILLTTFGGVVVFALILAGVGKLLTHMISRNLREKAIPVVEPVQDKTGD